MAQKLIEATHSPRKGAAHPWGNIKLLKMIRYDTFLYKKQYFNIGLFKMVFNLLCSNKISQGFRDVIDCLEITLDVIFFSNSLSLFLINNAVISNV